MRLALPVLASVLLVACGGDGATNAGDLGGGKSVGTGGGGSEGGAGGAGGGAALAIDHPASLCDDSQTHLRGELEGVDVVAHLCDFQYALVDHDPWLNWTKFGDGVLFLAGSENIFKTSENKLPAVSGLLRMPGVTKSGGQVYCGFDNGSYYEARDESAPDAEIELAVTGYAGACGGRGSGTLDFTLTFSENNVAQIAVGERPMTREVTGSVGDGEEFVFFLDDGFIDIALKTPLPENASGESEVARATIALRDGTKGMLFACGSAGGTLSQTHTEQGDEHTLHLTGIAPWLDCAETTPVSGAFTLTHDPRH